MRNRTIFFARHKKNPACDQISARDREPNGLSRTARRDVFARELKRGENTCPISAKIALPFYWGHSDVDVSADCADCAIGLSVDDARDLSGSESPRSLLRARSLSRGRNDEAAKTNEER